MIPGAPDVTNGTGYRTADLAIFIREGFRHMGCSCSDKAIRVLPSPQPRIGVAFAETHAMAGGACSRQILSVTIMIPEPPAELDHAVLARTVEHLAMHLMGKCHGDMSRAQRFAEPSLPSWAQGLKVRPERKKDPNGSKKAATGSG